MPFCIWWGDSADIGNEEIIISIPATRFTERNSSRYRWYIDTEWKTDFQADIVTLINFRYTAQP